MCFWIDIEWYRKIRVRSILAFLFCEQLDLREAELSPRLVRDARSGRDDYHDDR
jgi:hypothetical protein